MRFEIRSLCALFQQRATGICLIVVQCDVGVSLSAGVVSALSQFYNLHRTLPPEYVGEEVHAGGSAGCFS